MKYLKRFSESIIDKTKIESILKDNNISNYTINSDGSVDVSGNVKILSRTTRENYPNKLPIKFGSVSGIFDCSGNQFETFEFLPDDCSEYVLGSNPGSYSDRPFGKYLSKIFVPSQKNINVSSSIFNKLTQIFIHRCVLNNVWSGGKVNEYYLKESFFEARYEIYKTTYNSGQESYGDIFMEDYSLTISFDDKEILESEVGSQEPLELLKMLVEKLKGSDRVSDIKSLLNIFISLIKNDDDEYISYYESLGLSEIYDDVKSFSSQHLQYKQYTNNVKNENFMFLILQKLKRTDTLKIRDESNDCYAFIGKEEFIERGDGSYTKSICIENLCKIDLYDSDDLSKISLMKLRSRFDVNSKVYSIWLPKDFFDVVKDHYFDGDISDMQRDIINKYKEPV